MNPNEIFDSQLFYFIFTLPTAPYKRLLLWGSGMKTRALQIYKCHTCPKYSGCLECSLHSGWPWLMPDPPISPLRAHITGKPLLPSSINYFEINIKVLISLLINSSVYTFNIRKWGLFEMSTILLLLLKKILILNYIYKYSLSVQNSPIMSMKNNTAGCSNTSLSRGIVMGVRPA